MKKFVWKTGAIPQETFWCSRDCDAFFEQVCHIQGTHETALQTGIKVFNRGISPVFQSFRDFAVQFQRHFDPVYEFVN